MTTPKDHPLWNAFVWYAKGNGIGLEYENDWFFWWDCFLAGAKALHEGSKP